jgi:peptidyl-prolyl cis-trans isomerase C
MENAKILATVAGTNITDVDVYEAIMAMGQRGQSLMNPQGQQMVLDQLINRRLLLASAKRDLLEMEPEFKKQLAAVKDELLTKYVINKTVDGIKVSDEESKAYFEENREHFRQGETVRASHILVDTEEKAAAIKADIDSGKITFADAAKENSSCPSKEHGGDLGAFTHGQMVPEFDEAAFALAIGVVSEPVKTQFGYHLILVTEKNEDSEYAYEDIKDQLKDQLLAEKQQKAYVSKINQLKILFPVDRF